MVRYLVEIGTEELPYKFVPSAMAQISESLSKALEESRLQFSEIKTYGTPRRLTAIVEDLTESQPDIIKKIKGPPAKACYDANGNPTPAAEGFARKQGIEVSAFYKEIVGNVEYVFADIHEQGKPTAEVLKILIPQLILKLQGSHFMRWADLDIKFSRPIRWIVSLLGNEEVKISIGNVESSRTSRAHRFYDKTEVEITSIESYFDILMAANVIVDPETRKKEIIRKAQETAEKIGGNVYLSEDLLDEVTYITEWPVPVLGQFDTKYLEVPKDVIVTVMASHQRYFPVFEKNSENLMNCFITMSNQGEACVDNIKRGNERVIKARLDDAIFFYTEDNKKTLESRLEDLKGVTFQKGLGTMFDKTERNIKLSEFIASNLGLDEEEKSFAVKAAKLAKADLVTNLVREFTELQGVIGSQYAKLNGEPETVSVAVKEHYMPISSDGELAETLVGQIVGIADKIDTICGVFALGKAPTGSADPLGLRRAAVGVLQTAIKKLDDKYNIDLNELISYSISLLPINIEDKEKLKNDVQEFVIQRFRMYLNDTYKYDVVDAVLSARCPLVNLKDVIARAQIVQSLVESPDYNKFHEAANRIIRIIKEEVADTVVSDSLIGQEEERQLWDCASGIDGNTFDYDELAANLQTCIPVIDKFFDNVLVMDENPDIRRNRLAILANVRAKFLRIADFSKVVA